MKRKPQTLAFALLIVVSAVLIGVNWRLNNPSLSDADKQFRFLVADADRVEVKTSVCQNSNCASFSRDEYRTLNAEQTRKLIELIHLTDRTPAQFSRTQGDMSVSTLAFRLKQKKLLPELGLIRMARWSEFQFGPKGYAIHPRFEKPLRQFLDQIAPKRIRP